MRCNYCEWRCELGPERFGRCGMYVAGQDGIEERFPHRWSQISVSRIESMPFYHAYPGSRTLTIGTFGCNFRCRYCSNGFIARQDPAGQVEGMFAMTPEVLVTRALQLKCHNIVFNVNEPTVSLPSLREVKWYAARAGLPMGCLANGYNTEASLEMLSEIFSFVGVSLKGMNDAFYREYIGVTRLEPVLRNIRRLAQVCHLEVVTPVIEGVNDHELDAMADFLADLDPRIPWHVFRLLPEHEMHDTRYPSIDGINTALHSARTRLEHVYFHNFVGSDWVNTLCPGCGREVIERFSLGCGGDRLSAFHCRDNRCPDCGREIPLLGTRVPWNRNKEVL